MIELFTEKDKIRMRINLGSSESCQPESELKTASCRRSEALTWHFRCAHSHQAQTDAGHSADQQDLPFS